jgi:aspartate beta-hydroxylase
MSESVRPDAARFQALLVQLRQALGRGDDADAERLAEAILVEQPGHEPTLAYLSTRARVRGDQSRAVALAAHGLRQHPRSVLLLFNLGAALSADGHFAAAEVALQSAIAEQSGFLFAQFWLGTVQQQSGQSDASLRTRVRALAEAERQGFLFSAAQLPAEARQHIDAAIDAVHRGREQMLAAALQPVRTRHGSTLLQRVEQALGRHLGKPAPQPTHPLQQPSFLFLPGLPDKPWWEREAFPFLNALEEATAAIRAELLEVLADEAELEPYIDMPDGAPAAATWRALNRSPRWSGYHLYRDGARVEAHCRRCPHTLAALEALPLMRIPGHGPEALFSVLRPGTHIPPHTGVINGRLTVHLPLIVPADCGALAVAQEAREWQEGRCLVFDDSYVHEAWNRSAETRAVLIFDLWNPALTLPERAALTAGITALGAFNQQHGGDDPMQETG